MSTDPITEVNTAMDACVEAQEAGDFRTALTKARTAWIRMGQIPDSEFAEERLTWSRDAIQGIVEHLQQLTKTQGGADAAGGRGSLIRPISMTYERG